MKLYSENKDYKLYQGSMLDMLDAIEPNTIDSIITDPPYELNFMGKGWDNAGVSFQKETWENCYKVLKSGGYLLAFGGSRTYHRIACAIEDAGFEIRDTIMWLYGCLSNDTKILTSTGWKNSEEIKINDEIYSLDLQGNKLIKNKVKNVFKYDYDGEMVNLKNDNTNQLITPNHHCIVKDKIRTRIKRQAKYNNYDYWYYKDAWQLRSQNITLPLASNYNGTLEIGNLLSELIGWIISEGTYLKDTNAIMITQSSVNKEYVKRIRYILGKLKIKYNEYSRERTYKDKKYIEYDFYIGKNEEETVNKIKSLIPNKKLNYNLLELSLENKKFLIKGLLQGDGTKDNNTIGFSAFNQNDLEQLEIFQTLLHLTNMQGRINKNKMCCSIHNNPTTEIQGKHFKDRFVKYGGKFVWCIETEIGNFVAKRDGKIFITGNSGFPKSMNIGLAIDKKMGIESIDTGIASPNARPNSTKNNTLYESGTVGKDFNVKIAQNEWNGWGTCLKPSFEPIIVARKPFKGSLVDNVLEYGVGGLNIDECRVEAKDQKQFEKNWTQRKADAGFNGNVSGIYGSGKTKEIEKYKPMGRFPANTILTYDDTDYEEVCGGFPNTKSGTAIRHNSGGNTFGSDKPKPPMDDLGYNDSGSASRYFYCAKASKRDRDEGLEEFEEKTKVFNGKADKSSKEMKDVEKRFTTVARNTHPTVKPTELMQYLVRLVTPNGGLILDPFNGSGSTGKAVMYENKDHNKNYKYIGIELTKEYLPIAKARIEYACKKDNSQMTIFDLGKENDKK